LGVTDGSFEENEPPAKLLKENNYGPAEICDINQHILLYHNCGFDFLLTLRTSTNHHNNLIQKKQDPAIVHVTHGNFN
jgi:hypothetical protein